MIASEDKITQSSWTTMKGLWPWIQPFRWRLGGALGLLTLATIVEVVSPIVIGKAVDTAVNPARDRRELTFLCFAFLGLIVFRAVLESIQSLVIQSAGQKITDELRSALFRKIESLPVSYFDRNPTGRLLTRIVNDVKSLNELFTASISVLALDIAIIVGTVIAMLWVESRLALIVLIPFPIVVLSIRYFGRRLASAYRKVRVKLAEINSFLGENVSAIATIQRLAAESERYSKFQVIVDSHLQAQLESIRFFAYVQPVANILNGLSIAVLILLGGHWVIEGSMSIGILVAFLGYLRNIFQPIRDLVEKYNTFLSATVAGERVVAILNENSESAEGEAFPAPLGYDIVFEAVGFHYPMRSEAALDHVSFRLPAGESLAVVGATGSGKSTLIRLLLRFYEPDTGTIRIAGESLTDWNRQELRRRIGVVHQEIYLFQGTLRENLTLGRLGFSDDYLIEKCRRAQLWPLVEKRGGLDVLVMEGGSGFSLGERQLISFARVLVFDPPVLVLDEATSSVDRLLERRLMEAIHELVSGRTSIVIAHRLSTIRSCDHIIVLERGKVAEEGGFDSLVAAGGLFARFNEIHGRG